MRGCGNAHDCRECGDKNPVLHETPGTNGLAKLLRQRSRVKATTKTVFDNL
jgi:hypothetical protein